MNREDIGEVLVRGAAGLGSFFPGKTDLVFPILYSTCVWAGRRVFNSKDRLLTWRIWLDPESVRSKPDGFILNFFENDKTLREVYGGEIRAGDMAALRAAFPALYPVCCLEDAFLSGLFRDDLAAGDFKKIVAEFEETLSRIRDDIRAVEEKRDFWGFLEGLGMEIASLEINRLSEEDMRTLIEEVLLKKTGNGAPAGKGE